MLLSLLAVARRRRSRRTGRAEDAPLDASIFNDVDRISQKVTGLAERMDAAEASSTKMIQRVGVVRFNPFPDTGGNQSFVVALLNATGDGVVLSSLHARGGTRIYLKQVDGGKAETALSDEEMEAIRRARTG